MVSKRGITLFIVSVNMTGSSDLKNHLFISRGTSAYFFSRDLVFTVWVFLACLSRRCNKIQEKQLLWLVWVWTGPEAQTGLAHTWHQPSSHPRRGAPVMAVFLLLLGEDGTIQAEASQTGSQNLWKTLMKRRSEPPSGSRCCQEQPQRSRPRVKRAPSGPATCWSFVVFCTTSVVSNLVQ